MADVLGSEGAREQDALGAGLEPDDGGRSLGGARRGERGVDGQAGPRVDASVEARARRRWPK